MDLQGIIIAAATRATEMYLNVASPSELPPDIILPILLTTPRRVRDQATRQHSRAAYTHAVTTALDATTLPPLDRIRKGGNPPISGGFPANFWRQTRHPYDPNPSSRAFFLSSRRDETNSLS